MKDYVTVAVPVLLFFSRNLWVEDSVACAVLSVACSCIALGYLLAAFAKRIPVSIQRFNTFYFSSIAYLLIELSIADYDTNYHWATPAAYVASGVMGLAIIVEIVASIKKNFGKK